MADADRVRIEIGFDGGQIMGAVVTTRTAPTSWSASLAAGHDGTFALDAEDGRYTIVAPPGRLRQALRARGPGRLRRRLALAAGDVEAAMAETAQNAPRPGGARSAGSSSARSRATGTALEELYLIHFDRIYSYLHMSVGNRHDAEDLTTQTFLKMLESIGRSAGRRRRSRPGSSGSRTTSRWITSAPPALAARGGGARAATARRSARPRTRRSSRSAGSRCSS